LEKARPGGRRKPSDLSQGEAVRWAEANRLPPFRRDGGYYYRDLTAYLLLLRTFVGISPVALFFPGDGRRIFGVELLAAFGRGVL
jgi:hypothetical protein